MKDMLLNLLEHQENSMICNNDMSDRLINLTDGL
jgi:hypothetical protein